jgi:hypothetical protein
LARRSLALLFAGAVAPGCVIAVDDADDAGIGSTSIAQTDDGAGPSGPNTSGDEADSTDGATAGGTGDDGPATTGGEPTGTCGDNLIADGGFELGATDSPWEQGSELYDTPICDENCSSEPGAVPYAGSWWVWFGGFAQADNAFVAQTITIAGDEAFLRFYLNINAAAGDGNDVFEVKVDDVTVFMVTDAEMADFAGYREVQLSLAEFADGAAHRVSFEGTLTGVGMTNFFLDEVELFTCEVDGGDSSSGTAADDSGSGDSSGSTSASGTDTDAGTGGTAGTGTGTGGGTTGASTG